MADCIDPGGVAGEIIYSGNQRHIQYCNGAEWVGFPKTAGTGCGGLAPWAAHSVDAYGWDAVAYGAGRFVAVAHGSGRAMTSTDGINWDPIADVFGTDVVYGGGLFVVVTADHWQRRTFTSSDGLVWDTHDNALPAGGGRWHKLAYGDGHFVAVSWHAGGANKSIRSADGINWTTDAIGERAWWDVAYGNGRFVAVHYHWSDVAVSFDGIDWDMHTDVAPDIAHIRALAYGNGLFVAVATDGANRIMTSPDGITWTPRAAPELNAWESVTYHDGLFVAVASSGTNRVMTSADGIAWHPMGAAEANAWQSVAFGGGRFVAVANDGTNRVMTTTCNSPGCTDPDMPEGRIIYNGTYRTLQWCDGQNWHAAGPINPSGPNDGCEDPARTAGNVRFNEDDCILQYCDGDTWRGIGGSNPCACDADAGVWSVQAPPEASTWNTIAYGNGLFVAFASDGTDRLMTSADGIQWTPRTSPMTQVMALTFGGGQFVAISGWTQRHVATSPDGINWTVHSDAMPAYNNWENVVYGNNMYVAVSNDGANRVATSPDGVNWTGHAAPARTWISLAYGNGRFVAGTYDTSHVMVSTNGTDWTEHNAPAQVHDIAYGNGRFVIGTPGPGYAHYSTDGINWTPGTGLGTEGLGVIVYGDDRFVALAHWGGSHIYTSPDGINWAYEASPRTLNATGPGSMAYGNGTYVAVHNSGADPRVLRVRCLGGG